MAVTLGCIHDDIRNQPQAWTVVGCIPVYNHKEAMSAGRPRDGPEGIPRSVKELLHQCYGKLLEDWAELTRTIKYLEFADKVWRRAFLIVVGRVFLDHRRVCNHKMVSRQASSYNLTVVTLKS